MSKLEAGEISFGYKRDDTLFSNFSCSCESAERVALSGHSGLGKSTLCKLLSGYLTPRSGSILIDGSPLPTHGVSPVQMIWQHPELAVDPRLPLKKTLLEAGEIQQRLLQELGIRSEWFGRYPHELSGGELQRFCIARALMACPQFIIADEISTMLDAITQAHIWEVLLKECSEKHIGLVFVTHSEALANRIATSKIILPTK